MDPDPTTSRRRTTAPKAPIAKAPDLIGKLAEREAALAHYRFYISESLAVVPSGPGWPDLDLLAE